MKHVIIIVFLAFISCKQQTSNSKALQNRIDSLEHTISNLYTPGFGEFMRNIQAHHSKLWFAGKNNNWKLAEFEIKEMNESIDNIKKYESARKENKLIGMIKPALDSISDAINKKNSKLFKVSFVSLTNACNRCHHLTNFEYNIVKVPDVSPYSNQDFKVKM